MNARRRRGHGPVVDDFGLQAQRYVDAYGWALLPAKGKRPHVRRWERFQREQPCPKELADMFSVPGCTGLCVVAGAVSGGLVVRDYDQPDAYRAWAAGHADLAASLPTVQTARGYHVYFCGDVERIITLPDGELRGGGISLLPTSYHPSGTRYVWTVEPGTEIPLVSDPASAGLSMPQHAMYGLMGVSTQASSVLPRTIEEAQ